MIAAQTVEGLVNAIFSGALVIMILTLVASLGMSYPIKQLLAPLRRFWVVIAAILINVVIVPAVGWGICILFPLSQPVLIGIVLCTIGAGGPAGLKACVMAKQADLPLAISLVVVLALANIIAAPLWAQAVVSGASVSAWSIIKDLLILVLIPLVVGLTLRARYAEHADGWRQGLDKTSNIALVIAFGFGIAANWSEIVDQLGSWTIVVTIVLTLIFSGLGALIGLRDRPTAITGAMLTGLRFTPIGMLVVMTQLHGDPSYLAPTLVYGLVYTFLMFGLGLEIGHLEGPPKKQPDTTDPASG